jgi:hypothetical protein
MMHSKIIFSIWCIALFAAGSDIKEEYTTYSLDKKSFDAKHLEMVKGKINIKLPKGTNGLNLLYEGAGIDPRFYAKLEIPKESINDIVSQIEDIHDEITISEQFDTLAWWRPSKEMRISRCGFYKGKIVGVILCRENKKWILYVQWHNGT